MGVNTTDPAECDDEDLENEPGDVEVAGSDLKQVPDAFPICLAGRDGERWRVTITDDNEDTIYDESVTIGRDDRAELDWRVLPDTNYGLYTIEMTRDDNSLSDDFTVEQASDPKILVLPRDGDVGDSFSIYLGGFDDVNRSEVDLYLYIRCSDDPDRDIDDDDQACYRAPILDVSLDDDGEGETKVLFGSDLTEGTYFVVAAESGRVFAVSERFTLDR